uniref:Pecanex-like protein n=1 Tax=Echinostoma caproni TaxID=27848 RepID=A0A183BCI4_9TREM
LGANTQSTNQGRGPPPKLWSAEQLDPEIMRGPQIASSNESRGSLGVCKTPLAAVGPPPPLQLTITRDRLSYRGRTTSEVSDSNLSSSSGTESLLSSGEDDESLSIPSKHCTLPPPPSLERLPDRGGLHASGSATLSSISDVTSHVLSSRPSQASTSAGDINSSAAHSQLPPLLPLFSSIPADSATHVADSPPRLPTLDGFQSGLSSGPPSSRTYFDRLCFLAANSWNHVIKSHVGETL